MEQVEYFAKVLDKVEGLFKPKADHSEKWYIANPNGDEPAKANSYLVTLVHKQYYHVPVTAMNEDEASEQAHNIDDLSPYLVHDEGQDYDITSIRNLTDEGK